MSARNVYQIHGFQPDDAPHWSVAIIEAGSEGKARGILHTLLTSEDKRPDEVWGWSDNLSTGDYRDPDKWRVDEWTTPVRFVLGGGCR